MAHLSPGGTDENVTTSELKAQLADLRTELKGDIGELRTELYQVVSEQTRTMVLAIVASNATLTALVFGATRLA